MINNITRRAALGGLAAIPATGVALAAGRSSFPAGILTDAETVGADNGFAAKPAGQGGALERLQHHLLSAALALDEICPADNSRWYLVMGGKAGTWAPFFRVARFDTVREPLHEGSDREIDVEKMTIVHEFLSRAEP